MSHQNLNCTCYARRLANKVRPAGSFAMPVLDSAVAPLCHGADRGVEPLWHGAERATLGCPTLKGLAPLCGAVPNALCIAKCGSSPILHPYRPRVEL